MCAKSLGLEHTQAGQSLMLLQLPSIFSALAQSEPVQVYLPELEIIPHSSSVDVPIEGSLELTSWELFGNPLLDYVFPSDSDMCILFFNHREYSLSSNHTVYLELS